MKLDIVSYFDLLDPSHNSAALQVENALLRKGIVGIKDVLGFENKTRHYVNAVREFSALPDAIKLQYAPNQPSGTREGYELGAEWFKNQEDVWQIDDKKASFYAYVPDNSFNIWPREVDLKTPYLDLGLCIFNTGKLLLNIMGLNESIGLKHDLLVGYGRMLHYHKESDATNANPNWCGAHYDHGVFTGLVPAYYFRDGKEIEEPLEAGLYITPSDATNFEKINTEDKSILLFQTGEFGQLISNDRIKATKHVVKKAKGGIERFTFALFYSADENTVIKSSSQLIKDARYAENQFVDASISYKNWEKASHARYKAKVGEIVTTK